MIQLSKIPTKAPKGTDKDDIKKETKKMAKRIAELQYVMMAEKKHSLLVILQGMDSSGKDGATKNVFGECGAAGINVASFKKPTSSFGTFIPLEISKHSMFNVFHEKLCWETKLGAISDTWLRLEYHKSILRACGQFERTYSRQL